MERLLIVEDDPLERTLLVQILSADGYPRVDGVTSAEEAWAELERARDHGDLPDLILCDLGLPGEDGLTFCRRLKESDLAHLPLVMVTASEDAEDLRRAFAVGAADYLTKPATAVEISTRVRHTLDLVDARRRQRKAESDGRRLLEQMHQSQRLESLGLLAGGIAHDFNNLLAVVAGNVEIAGRRMHEGSLDRAHEALEQVRAATRNAAELARQMLAFSGRGTLLAEAVDLRRTISGMAELLSSTLAKKIRLEYGYGDAPQTSTPPLIVADPSQIQQIVLNLVTNAAEAIGESVGSVRLECRVEEVDDERLQSAIVTDASPGHFAILEVADDGPGIDPELVRRIFDPFFTTKGQGRGLGMSAIVGIVGALGGAVEVDSSSAGTTIRVLLPQAVPKPKGERDALRAAVVAESSSEVLRDLHVLVADDEKGVREVLARLLRMEGCRVSTAEDGRAALQIAQEHADDLALVFLDVSMPYLSGVDVLHALREARIDLPVVLCSGFSSEREPLDGRTRFLAKPFDRQQLLAVVEQALRT